MAKKFTSRGISAGFLRRGHYGTGTAKLGWELGITICRIVKIYRIYRKKRIKAGVYDA
jgi:hypothetical protein